MVNTEYQSALLGLGIALACSAITLLLIRLSSHLALVAKVRSDRWHRIATPNSGGIAIVVGCLTAACCATLPSPYPLILGVGAALGGLGAIDDRFQLRPMTKLAGQAVAASIVIANGVVFRPSGGGAVDVAITLLWIVGITNAFNLIDNMDGLCAGVVIIIAVFRWMAAIQTGDQGAAFTMAILGGGYAGFLLFNYKPAKVFMGDSGSMFAGFVLASVTICNPAPGPRLVWFGLYYPALTFLYPIFDTALVCILRRLAGRPVSVGGRDHSSHRLVLLGLRERKTVSILWSLTTLGAAVGLYGAWMPFKVVAPCGLLLFGVTVFGAFLGWVSAFEMPGRVPIRSE